MGARRCRRGSIPATRRGGRPMAGRPVLSRVPVADSARRRRRAQKCSCRVAAFRTARSGAAPLGVARASPSALATPPTRCQTVVRVPCVIVLICPAPRDRAARAASPRAPGGALHGGAASARPARARLRPVRRVRGGQCPATRARAAYLAARTGAPVVPVTITGADFVLRGRWRRTLPAGWSRRPQVRVTVGAQLCLRGTSPREYREGLPAARGHRRQSGVTSGPEPESETPAPGAYGSSQTASWPAPPSMTSVSGAKPWGSENHRVALVVFPGDWMQAYW